MIHFPAVNSVQVLKIPTPAQRAATPHKSGSFVFSVNVAQRFPPSLSLSLSDLPDEDTGSTR